MAGRVGQQLGNYRLIRLIGRGGFAEVYLGKHIHLDTLAAVKVLHTQLSQSAVEKFRTEARTIARLAHPHIVRVLDFGVEGNTPCLVMEYAPNGSLRQHHPKGLSLPLPTIAQYVNQIADALHYAHNAKLIHRDVKPENMLVGPRNEVLLGDFGIALVAQSSRYRSVQEMAGTIAYMAPEQIHAQPEPASDQYALGIVVYEWLCGEHPFHGSFFEVASQHMLTPPPPLYGRVPDVTPAIEQVVLTAIAKDPQQRFVSVQAFANAFKQACHDAQRHLYASPDVVRQPYRSQSPRDALALITDAPEKLKRVLPRRTVLVGLTGLLAIVGAGTATLALTGKVPNPLAMLSGSSPGSAPARTPTPFPQPGTTLFTYRGHSDQVWSVKWSPEGTQIASGSFDTTVQVWDSLTGNNVLSYHGHNDRVSTLAWSLDGTQIASGGFDSTVQVWDATSAAKLYTYTGHAQAVRAIAWSPKPTGKYIASASADNTVQVWDAQSRVVLTTYRGHSNGVNALAWSPDGTRIVSGSADKTVQIWEVTTGKLLITYSKHTNEVRSVAWSPDGTRIVSSGFDRTAQIWDANSGVPILTFNRHTDYVDAVTWSRDGKTVASASSDATVKLWDAESGDVKLIYNGHTNHVIAVAWSPDGTKVTSGGFDDTVQVWQAI